MSTGLIDPLAPDSYMPADYSSGNARYQESISLIEQAFKEQQYWVSVYNRTQQFGLSGYTTQEVINQMLKTSQRMKNLQQVLLPAMKTSFTQEIDGVKNLTKDIKINNN